MGNVPRDVMGVLMLVLLPAATIYRVLACRWNCQCSCHRCCHRCCHRSSHFHCHRSCCFHCHRSCCYHCHCSCHRWWHWRQIHQLSGSQTLRYLYCGKMNFIFIILKVFVIIVIMMIVKNLSNVPSSLCFWLFHQWSAFNKCKIRTIQDDPLIIRVDHFHPRFKVFQTLITLTNVNVGASWDDQQELKVFQNLISDQLVESKTGG